MESDSACAAAEAWEVLQEMSSLEATCQSEEAMLLEMSAR